MPVRHITGSGFSSLPTPTVADQFTGSLSSTQQTEGSLHSVSLAQVFHREDLFPTPNTMEHLPARTGEARERQLRRGDPEGSRRSSMGNLREDVMDLIPTPTTRDYKDGSAPHERDGEIQTDTVARAVFNSGEVTDVSWGKFAPAVKRWEQVLGRPAPAPTKPDGKDGAHRLSSSFTEWMMGLDDGWITSPEIGLSRNDALKACGNGVVPQQAVLALRYLLRKGNDE